MPALESLWEMFKDYLYGGIDFSLPGNGGPDCVAYIPPDRRILETVFTVFFCGSCFVYGWQTCQKPRVPSTMNRSHYRIGRIILAVLFAFVIGMEVTYKFATRQGIFAINPCHLLSMVQIYLLAAPPTSVNISLFRVHCYFLHGPLMAVVFPVNNTLFLPLEIFTYWIQHAFLLGTPVYMIWHGGHYTLEDNGDFSWQFISYGLWGLYHFLCLQPLAIWSQANLNSMLCPAISDPFYGPNYRLNAIWHQFVLNLLAGKTCAIFGVKGAETRASSEKAVIQNGGDLPAKSRVKSD